jgi:glycosyltransferase involved in cell wall biosynthesis
VTQLRVALLTPCFWPEVRRGTERFTRELADGLLARGHHPTVITSHPGPPRRSVEDGATILRLPRPPQGRLVRRRYELYMTHVPLSYAALRAGQYDIAHAMHPPDALAAVRWKRGNGRPAILSYMGIPDRQGLRERRKRLEAMLAALRGCDAAVALSDYAGEAFRYWLGYDARVIPPGVDVRTFKPTGPRSPRPTIVCSAAAEEPRKNVALLVKALEVVRRSHADARLVLSRPRDLEAVRRIGVDVDAPGVEWANLDDRDALARAYGEAWVAVLASNHEAFGLVLAEALACGTPVVGYNHSAIPEVIDSPQIGRLFDTLEPEALAAALVEVMELSKDPATAARCRSRAEEFTTDRFTERYLDLYRELLDRRG